MENKTINLAILGEVALVLSKLNETIVFVGGAILSIYADDPSADEVRPTTDIDLTVKILSMGNWEKFQEELGNLSIYPDPFGHSICSYKYKNIAIDIMPSEDGPFGPANPWYKHGFDQLWKVNVMGNWIYVLPTPCYLATKFEAFNNRGNDYRTSHDFEDIIYVFDNRIDIVEEILSAPFEIKNFIKSQLLKLENYKYYNEVLVAHIHPLIQFERIPLLKDKIHKVTHSS